MKLSNRLSLLSQPPIPYPLTGDFLLFVPCSFPQKSPSYEHHLQIHPPAHILCCQHISESVPLPPQNPVSFSSPLKKTDSSLAKVRLTDETLYSFHHRPLSKLEINKSAAVNSIFAIIYHRDQKHNTYLISVKYFHFSLFLHPVEKNNIAKNTANRQTCIRESDNN